MRQLVRSVSGDNLVFYFSTISWLRLQQETMWVNINFERRDLTSVLKVHLSPGDFGETFTFNLIKQNVTHLVIHLFNTKLFAMPINNLNLNYHCQVLQVSPHRINGGFSDKGCSSVPSASPPLPLLLLDMQPHQTVIFKMR